ncbi:MAG: hypothetical protein RLZZ234_115 [Candidatus Parcubacteria bacterium]|jgi:RND family efflux transporter MFP subunit
MHFIRSIFARLVAWYGKRTVIIVLALIAALAAVGGYKMLGTEEAPQVTTPALPLVNVMNVNDMMGTGTSLTVLGTVEATREARLVTEAGGRVTNVAVGLGDTVRAGAVLASIENSRERAVVLQAQGAYEGALAGASSGNTSLVAAERSLSEAKTSAQNTYRSSFTTIDGVLRNTIDTLFSDPTSAFPGLLIDGKGRATAITTERTQIGALLDAWKTATDDSRTADLDAAEQTSKRVSIFLADLSNLYADDTNLPPQLAGIGAGLTAARAQADGTLAAISQARQALIASENAVAQAKIAGSSTGPSASGAQIKQALGSLRLAQANLEKTIVRSPISGTVQSLTLKEGTAVSMGTPAAIISSEGALEIVTYVTDEDARTIAVGSKVLVEQSVPGVVTALASAIDPVTKKIEMRIGIDNQGGTLTNGQSVTVSLLADTVVSEAASTVIELPIVALKMTPDGAVVFTVSEESTLISHKVTLGAIRGDSVVVTDGVTPSMKIVTDARGLRDGENVEVK